MNICKTAVWVVDIEQYEVAALLPSYYTEAAFKTAFGCKNDDAVKTNRDCETRTSKIRDWTSCNFVQHLKVA